jgi:hypothetical protein
LTGGEECFFEVVASAGVRTTTSRSERFNVRRKPREAYILMPSNGSILVKSQSINFLGGGFSPDFGTPEFTEVQWTSSLDGFIGSGYHVAHYDLSAGRHKITLSVPDGLGGEASAIIFVTVRGEAEAA